jgi:DNA replication and repair protein RecF
LTTKIAFERIAIRDFRNLREVLFEPSPRINVVSGDNGQGKTSILEAIYFVSTSRSFRAERAREMLRQGAEAAAVRATIVDSSYAREQRATIVGSERAVLVDGKKPETLASFATKTPVVVFHPGDLAILSGPASGRRTLLDRIALFVDPSSAQSRQRYARATRARQAALAERGPNASDLGPIERVMAVEGAALERSRAEAASRLASALLPVFERMGAPGLVLEASFVPGGSFDENAFACELSERRPQDLRRGSASYGPHKSDLDLRLDGRSVRRHASQGQLRITTLALKVAELDCVREARGSEPVLLLDDVSSELDPGRTGAVYEFLRETPSQVFVTTTRPDLFVLPSDGARVRADFRLSEGAISRVPE